MQPETDGINLRSEQSLHRELKRWYAETGDRLEVEVQGYVIDLVRGPLLIEIQTRHFSAMRHKIKTLLKSHPVRVVYPVAAERTIVKLDDSGQVVLRRKSPKHGCVQHVFSELVYITELVVMPGFSLDVLLVRDEEVRQNDGRGSWRRKGWSIADRRLVEVLSQQAFATPDDYLSLLPDGLPQQFTTADLARSLKQPRRVAQQMAYSLRQMGLIEMVGKQGNAIVYCV